MTGWTRSTCASLARRLLGRSEPVPSPVEQTFWYRSTKFVMRHAIPVGLAIIALLLVLGAPFLGVKWGFPDDRVLPQSLSARQVGDSLRTDFAVDSATDVTAGDSRHVDGVTRRRAEPPTPQIFPRCPTCRRCRRRAAPSFAASGRTAVGGHRRQGRPRFRDRSAAPRRCSPQTSETQLDRLHAVAAPAVTTSLLTGTAQINRDSSQAVTSRIPLCWRSSR